MGTLRLRDQVRNERGIALISVLIVALILASMGAAVLYTAGQEMTVSVTRQQGANSMNIAEGGAAAARAGLMALVGADPVGKAVPDESALSDVAGTLETWFAGGVASNQDAFSVLRHFKLIDDGNAFLNVVSSGATTSINLDVNEGLTCGGAPCRTLRVQLATGVPPSNPLGDGSYRATIQLSRPRDLSRPELAHPSCAGGGGCAIHRLSGDANQEQYEFFYDYVITSDGEAPRQATRRVVLEGTFSFLLERRNFARYSAYMDNAESPTGQPIWFTNRTNFGGPVHSNGTLRFAFFPNFADTVSSASATAWYNNGGSPVQLAADANIVSGYAVDAPVNRVPLDPMDPMSPIVMRTAAFSRSVPSVSMPTSSFSQQGAAIGRDPATPGAVTDADIRSVVPELADGSTAVPTGIYVPVRDADGNCRSDAGEAVSGGVYVKGPLDSLTMSVSGTTATYSLVQGSTTVIVTVDRAASRTTVAYAPAWITPPTAGTCTGVPATAGPLTFNGVPKGWQGFGNNAAMMIYVDGDIRSLSGMLQRSEQTTIAASGSIEITNHVRYESPPVCTGSPGVDPVNMLGVYSSGGDIRISDAAPANLDVHGILMAGSSGSAYRSSIFVEGFDSAAPKGNVNLIGGTIEKYRGGFGRTDPSTGNPVNGYGRNFSYDCRVRRGFAPPHFPTASGRFNIARGVLPLAGVRPTWRESLRP